MYIHHLCGARPPISIGFLLRCAVCVHKSLTFSSAGRRDKSSCFDDFIPLFNMRAEHDSYIRFFSLFFVTPTCLSNYRVLTDGMRYFARRASDIDRNRMTIEEFSFVDGQKKKAKKMNWKDGQH